MSKYPEPKGQNGDTSFEDWAHSMVQWVEEKEFLGGYMSGFVKGCLKVDEVEAALIAARGTPDEFDRIIGLAWIALHEGADAAIVGEMLEVWDELEFPEFDMYNRSTIGAQKPVIAGLLTLRVATRHDVDASSVAALVNDRFEVLVDVRARMSPILELFLELDEIDEALKLHERLSVPWEEGIEKDGIYFDHPSTAISGKIVARLLAEGRDKDAEALVARGEIDYPGDGMTSKGYTWENLRIWIFNSMPDAEVDRLRPLMERVDERDQMSSALNILRRGTSTSDSTWYNPIQDSIEHDELLSHLNARARLTLGDVKGFREHFEPREDQCYAFEEYRTGTWDAEKAIAAVDDHYEEYSNYIQPVRILSQLTHQALDWKKMDDAFGFLARAEAIIKEAESREMTQYERGMKASAFISYAIAKIRAHLIEGDKKKTSRIQKEVRKVAKSQDDRAVMKLAMAELKIGLPEEAVRTAMKFKLKDRKEARGEVVNTLPALAAHYLPEDVDGAYRTIDKVLGTPKAKAKITALAFERM